jgi:trypsin-like peptidase
MGVPTSWLEMVSWAGILVGSTVSAARAVMAGSPRATIRGTGWLPERDEFDLPLPPRGLGSGFIVDRRGCVLTNFHVVDDAEAIKSTLSDERSFRGTLVGGDRFGHRARGHHHPGRGGDHPGPPSPSRSAEGAEVRPGAGWRCCGPASRHRPTDPRGTAVSRGSVVPPGSEAPSSVAGRPASVGRRAANE